MKAKKAAPDVSAQQRHMDKLRRDAQEARCALREAERRARHASVFVSPHSLAFQADLREAQIEAAWAQHALHAE